MTALTIPVQGLQVENAAKATSIALPYPATAVGDYMVFAVAVKSGTAPTLPSGWTTLASLTNAGSSLQPALLVAGKAATGSESGNLTVVTPNVVSIGQVWSVANVDLTNPVNASSTFNQSTGATTLPIPGVTTTSDGCLLFVAATDSAAAHTATPPSGFTETADLLLGTQPLELAYSVQVAAGATGTVTVAWTNGNAPGTAQSIGALIALNPRVAPTNSTLTFAAGDPSTTSTTQTAAPGGNPTLTFAANDATVAASNPAVEASLAAFAANDATVNTSALSATVDLSAGTQIVPGVATRIRAVWDGIVYDLWRGNVDSWDISYLQSNNYSQATINATDITKMIATSDRPAVTPIGNTEDTGARIDRILNSVGWPTTDRIISTGDSTLQATDLSGNAWQEIQTAALSEAADVFCDPAGRVVFRNRRNVLTNVRQQVPQAIFGDMTDSVANLLDNPNFLTGIAGWDPGGSAPPTLQWNAVEAYPSSGSPNSMRVAWGAGGAFPNVNAGYLKATVGGTYSASVYVKVPTGSPDVILVIGAIGLGTSTSTKDAWVELKCENFAATSNLISVQVWPVTSPVGGEFCYVGAAQLETGATASAFNTTVTPAELPFFDLGFSYDDDALWNVVGATANGGTRQEATDADSVQQYGARAVELSGLLLEADADTANYAGYVLHLSKNPEYRLDSVTIKPLRDPSRLFPVALGLGYGDRIRVNLSQPDDDAGVPRARMTFDGFIRGVSHTFNPDGEWETRWVTQAASKFSFFTIGDPLLGQVGNAAMSF